VGGHHGKTRNCGKKKIIRGKYKQGKEMGRVRTRKIGTGNPRSTLGARGGFGKTEAERKEQACKKRRVGVKRVKKKKLS